MTKTAITSIENKITAILDIVFPLYDDAEKAETVEAVISRLTDDGLDLETVCEKANAADEALEAMQAFCAEIRGAINAGMMSVKDHYSWINIHETENMINSWVLDAVNPAPYVLKDEKIMGAFNRAHDAVSAISDIVDTENVIFEMFSDVYKMISVVNNSAAHLLAA